MTIAYDNYDTTLQSCSTNPCVTATYRVLVVEDDPALRDLMVQILAYEGYLVTEAEDAQTMISVLRGRGRACDHRFELIITDVLMPGWFGLEALTKVRALGCDVPVIIVSALPGDMVQPQAQELNAHFLPKPFALENLRRIANRILSERAQDSERTIGPWTRL